MENKFPKGKIALYMLCAAGALILLIISVISFGWFVTNKRSEGSMTGLRAVSGKFELASLDSSGKYDELLTSSDGVILNDISVDGSILGKISPSATGSGGSEIKWLMSSESNFGNYNGENSADGIQPGSSGKLTFYVIAKQDTDLDLTFSLDTILYTNDAKPITADNTDNSDCIIPSDSPEAKLVKGHILFFENYDKTSKLYSDRIYGNKVNFVKQGAKADTAYRVDIYWIWPDVADQLVMPQNDGCFGDKEYYKVISDSDTAALITEMAQNPEYYFADNAIADLSAMLENVSKGSADVGFNIEYYNTLNAEWNEADQTIGSMVGYIELQLTADERSAEDA